MIVIPLEHRILGCVLRSTHTIEKVLILGSSGRVGRLLYAAWQHSSKVSPVWHIRSSGAAHAGVEFDILREPLKMLDAMSECDAVLNLAGVTPAGNGAMEDNGVIARAVVRSAASAGQIPVVHLSSAAVYRSATQAELSSGTPQVRHREVDATRPTSSYGIAKLDAEEQIRAEGRARGVKVTCLRLGNLLGADHLFAGNGAAAAIELDRFPSGVSPKRSYIGPQDLAAVLEALLPHALALPDVINVALDGVVEMADLLHAAGRGFGWRSAPDSAIPVAELDVSVLAGLVELPSRNAAGIVQDFRLTQGETS
jgi:nucleoside-diphosphate-sugar epimerase